VTDRRGLLWLVAGLCGLGIGALGALSHEIALAVIAGACALAAGVGAYRLVGRLRGASEEIKELSEQVETLETSMQKEHEARAQAEAELDAAMFAAHIERTAFRSSSDEDSLTDEVTGLNSESYFLVAVDARVQAARRHLRPVAVVLMEVVEGLGSDLPHLADPVEVAGDIKETLRGSDTACRLSSGVFALLLEDTPENGAIWTVERLRRVMAIRTDSLTLWAGIACYPAHGFSGDELIARAESALGQAKEWRQDRIEVAPTGD
jgi:diguanylate cyclase (GGDEF)-like protein